MELGLHLVLTVFYGILLTVPSLCKSKDIKSVSSSLELQCPPCDRMHCTPKKAKKLNCKGGITKGICNCCPVCAKVEGEECGGESDYRGKCDVGLMCKPTPNQIYDFRTYSKHYKPEGICTLDRTRNVDKQLGDQPTQPFCKPKCTPKYCGKNSKRKICSAVDNAEVTQSCQGDCQHTSCSACRFVKEDTECEKCDVNDFSCMKRFGRCVRKQYCTREKFPCRTGHREDGAKFKCIVPECINMNKKP